MKKGVATSVFLVIGGAIAIIIGIWLISAVNNSIALPTTTTTIVNDTITFTANDTYYDFGNQAVCLDDLPVPSSCGALVVSAITNASYSVDVDVSDYTASQIKLVDLTGEIDMPADYDVTYTYADYADTTPSTTLNTTKSTVWNSFTLLAVGLIVVAAGIIIGYFTLGKRR